MTGENPKTILLVEDEVLIAHMEKAMLERHGFQVLTEYKGENAVARVEETPGIDLILMDINLGSGMSGPEAAEKILEKHDIPLIFLSSHAEPEVVSQAERITSYGYLLKNSEETVVITCIRMAFRLFESKLREKERSEQLLESEKNLAEAQRVAKLGHWKFDVPSSTIVWSDEIFNILEIEKSEFRGTLDSYISIIHPDDKPFVLSVSQGAMETGEEFEVGYRIITKGGKIKYIQERGYVIQDKFGEVVSLFGTAQDLTDLKLVFDAYRDSEQKWKSLVENSPDFIGIFDREGKVLSLNRYAAGYSEQDVIGVSGYNFIPPDNKDEWKSHFEECLDKRTTKVFRNYGFGDNMTRRIFENYFIFLTDHAEGPSVIGITKDVTDQVELQESLNLEIAEKELLLKEVHHRIKNNLASVEKIIQIQAESLAENSLSRNILQGAIGRVESMRMIYEKLLNTSDYTTISTKEYLEDLIGKIRSFYTEIKEMQLEITIEDIPLSSRQIFSIGIIVNELFSNIMKYAFPHERFGMVIISLEKSGSRVTFLVRDNGSGFPEGFSPDQSKGLGMMFINILTKQLNGTCTFENKNGISCTIEFET